MTSAQWYECNLCMLKTELCCNKLTTSSIGDIIHICRSLVSLYGANIKCSLIRCWCFITSFREKDAHMQVNIAYSITMLFYCILNCRENRIWRKFECNSSYYERVRGCTRSEDSEGFIPHFHLPLCLYIVERRAKMESTTASASKIQQIIISSIASDAGHCPWS